MIICHLNILKSATVTLILWGFRKHDINLFSIPRALPSYQTGKEPANRTHLDYDKNKRIILHLHLLVDERKMDTCNSLKWLPKGKHFGERLPSCSEVRVLSIEEYDYEKDKAGGFKGMNNASEYVREPAASVKFPPKALFISTLVHLRAYCRKFSLDGSVQIMTLVF